MYVVMRSGRRLEKAFAILHSVGHGTSRVVKIQGRGQEWLERCRWGLGAAVGERMSPSLRRTRSEGGMRLDDASSEDLHYKLREEREER
jgi:hypothetical protein